MNITKEDIDDLNAVVRVNLEESDYIDQVTSVLKDHRKKARVPGFRPGMVPMGMIKQMYGRSVLAEELNRAASNSLYQYITENKIEILGNPLPKNEEIKLDLDKSKNFEFIYDLGIAPKVNLKISNKDKFDLLEIQIDDKLIEKNANELRKRFGKVGNSDVTAGNEMVQGDFRELDGKELKEGGIYHTSTIALEYIEDEKVKKTLLGKKAGDKIVVDPHKVSKGGADLAAMLNIDKEQAAKLKSKFEFEVKQIYSVELAELNEEFFDKAFGKGVVKTEDEFKNKLSEELSKQLAVDSKRKLQNDIIIELLNKAKLALPDDFLKRWLLLTNDKLTQEQLDEEYEEYAKSLKWQLIQNKIIKDHDIKVEHTDVVEHTKGLMRQQMAQYGMQDMPEEELTSSANRVLENREEAQRVYQQLYDVKVMELFENTFKLKNKSVSYDEFVKLATEKKGKGILSSIKDNLNL